MKHFLQKSIVFFLAFDLVFAPLSVAAQETGKETGIAQESAPGSETISYTQLMRNTHALATGKRVFVSEPAAELPAEALRAQTLNDFERFIDAEKKRLDDEGIGWLKQRRYLKRLERQIQLVDGVDPPAFGRIAIWFKKLFGKEEVGYEPKEARREIIPQKPARFEFENQVIQVKSINLTESLPVTSRNDKHTVSLGDAARTAFTIRPVYALEDNLLPSYEDITADGGEALVTSEIQELASSLAYNPVAISNFVRNAVTYEPYWGAKKGSVGCLRELVCNDVDTASLTIALLRASGIPARYKKTVSVFSVDQLKRLLGVEEAKSAYAAFAFNHIPIFTISGNPDAGRNLDDADLSQETHFAVEWTHVEAFYDYDDRGGNTANLLDVSTVQNTAELRDLLRGFYKKQWVPIDAVLKSYAHEQANIVSDQANFDTEAFWNGYFAYQGDLAPLKKYRADLLQATGQDIDANRSVKRSVQTNHTVLPPTLPYTTGQGVAADGAVIAQESWSALPDARKQQVTITLQRAENNATVLRHTFFASEINNALLTLTYEGATPQDQQTIEQRGGIHQTPAEIVHIIPYLATDFSRYQGINNDPDNTPIVSIGEPLVLQFEYRGAGDVKTDQKFSVAGNHEGIFMTFSGIQDNFIFDDADDPNRASKILLEGNAAIAREYLKTVFTDAQTLEQTLDYEYNIEFARAVVTQNRVLSEVDGAPTTFDFKGLSIDSGAYIADYSNRGDYKNHRKDFRLLWGLIASHWEGRIFSELTGLDAIATVQGIQYAHAHPETYTVHRITAQNEADIDNLNLSDNTKANMHAAVAAGNTIITPDRPIEDGAFRGIVYVSLDPEWTGTYAIGEQVGNGGFTTDGVLVAGFFDNFLQRIIEYQYAEKDDHRISYQDGRSVDGILCRVIEARHNELVVRPDWENDFGFPCLEETKQFGNDEHSYILASNAAKFFSPNRYNYWKYRSEAKQVLEEDKNDDNVFDLNNIRLDSTFKFNAIAGTFSQFGHYGWPGTYITAYYQPTNDGRGQGRMVFGEMLSKLQDPHYDLNDQYLCHADDPNCGKLNWILNKLGYPSDNRRYAATHEVEWGRDTNGEYQNFAGGQIYRETTWRNYTYYVPWPISDYYNSDENVLNGERGSGGKLGFPSSDPYYKQDELTLKQKFEGGGIVWNTITDEVGFEYAAEYYCDEINGDDDFIVGKAFLHGLWDGGGNLVKAAVVFGGATLAMGSAIDFIFGTHGGATVAAWSLIGGGVAYAIYEVQEAGIDNVLAGVENRIQFEIEHSDCKARKAYLLARYAPEFGVFVLGMRDLARATPKQLRGLSMTSNILTVSRSEVIPRMKTVFAENIGFFKSTFRNGDDDVAKIVDKTQQKFDNEVVALTKSNDRSLTQEELSGIASKVFTDDIAKALGWKRLSNVINGPNDATVFPDAITNAGLKDFYVVRGKIRAKLGTDWKYSSVVKVVVRDGKLYYGKVKPLPDGTFSNHAQLVQSMDADGAFTLLFNNKGELVKYNHWSGHYETPEERIILLEYYLEKSGVDMSKAQKVGLNDLDIGDPNLQ